MLATAEKILETWETSPKYRSSIRYALAMPSTAKPTVKYVDKMLEKVFDRIDSNSMGKGVRPWDIMNITADLDPTQCWIGIEFETGFDDKRNYDLTMNYLWKNHSYNAVDYEGCGSYPCEITFSPVNMDTFHTDKYDMDRLLAFLNERELEQADRDYRSHAVGIHVNVSSPALRELSTSSNRAYDIAEVLSNTLDRGHCDSQKFFGRQPYGYFEARSDQYGNQWLEGKLFDSTHSMETWEAYKITINNLALLVEWLASVESLNDNEHITNIDKILAGELDAEDAEFEGGRYDDDDDDW